MKKVCCIVLVIMIFCAASALSAAVDSIEIPTLPSKIEEIIEEHQTVFRLSINYIYRNGKTAAPSYTGQMDVGAEYRISSPEISGYAPTKALVSGVMPARDVEYTVIYIPRGANGEPIEFFTLDDYEVPLGFGASFMNVGVCVE